MKHGMANKVDEAKDIEETEKAEKVGRGNRGRKYGKTDINFSWVTCSRVALTVLAVFLVIHYWGSVEGFFGLLLGGMIAIIAGLIIAYIVNIPMRFFERKLPGPTGDGTRNRALSIALSVICAVVVVLFVGILVIPNLIGAIAKLAEAAPGVIESITNNEFLSKFIPPGVLELLSSIDWDAAIAGVTEWLKSGLLNTLPQIMSAFGQIGACFMGVIFAFWFLGEKDKLSHGVHTIVKTYISERADARFSSAIVVADKCFSGYFKGAALEGTIFGTIVAVICSIAGVPSALMLGALVGVMSLIPMIGALIGAILGAIIILATSWEQALIFLVLFFIVQQVEANLIYPRVVGKHVGLTGMWPLVGVTLGVALFGFIGAFIGVPLIATIFRVVEADIKRREQAPGAKLSPLEKLQQSLSD